MEKRPVPVICQEMKASVSKLLEAMKRAELAHRDMALVVVGIMNLSKRVDREKAE